MVKTQPQINDGLLAFLHSSPTPFHAVATMKKNLTDAGYIELQESEAWRLEEGQGYFFTRNESSIIAFNYASSDQAIINGLKMVGAHTDSPCLKVKNQPELHREGYGLLGVETYGGVLLAPWFDRDLSIAGRVHYRDGSGILKSVLIDLKDPVATVPSLAIHLNREANSKHSINAHQHLSALLFQSEEGFDFRGLLNQHSETVLTDEDTIIDFDLCLYDTQAPALIGLEKEFIASARLDNLLSCYIGLQALIDSDHTQNRLLVCNDHEEVGSVSSCGAQGPMLNQCLQRLYPDLETRLRILDRSMMISADNAHGVHPNYRDKHDENHRPLLNKGPVIKINANQRYATNGETSSLVKLLCEENKLPVQTFINRADLSCGSTIGPLTAAEVGVKTIDIGAPTFAMHSIRELAGSEDTYYLYQLLKAFYQS